MNLKIFFNVQLMLILFSDFHFYGFTIQNGFKSKFLTKSEENSYIPYTDFIMSFLLDLFSSKLKGEKLFLVSEDTVIENLNIDSIIKITEMEPTTWIISKLGNLDSKYYRKLFVKTQDLIVVLAFNNNSIEEFFNENSYDDNLVTNKIIFVFLNTKQNLEHKIFSSVNRKFKYILIAELKLKMNKPFFSLYSIRLFPKTYRGMVDWKLFRLNKNNNQENLFIDRVSDFQGNVLKVTTSWLDFPYLYQWQIGDIEEKLGSNIDILKLIGKKLNFTFVLIDNEDQYWGEKKNGSWIGLLGDLVHKRSDISINSHFLFTVGIQEFTYSQQYTTIAYAFLSMLPAPYPDWTKLVMPFSMSSWLATISTMVVSMVLYYFSLKFSLNHQKIVISSAILMILKISLRQNLEKIIGGIWEYIWICVWMLTMFLLTSAYTGILISFLTVPRYPKRIDTLQELADSNLRVIQTYYNSNILEMIINFPYKAVVELGHKVETKDEEFMATEAPELVKQRKAVVLEVDSYLMLLQFQYNITGRSYIVKEQIFKSGIVFMFKKHSVFMDPINENLMRLFDTGICDLMYRKHTEYLGKSEEESDDVRKFTKCF
ncbi:UNVERIFIED_CONTAM: hypothetical protein RMT77_007981 [Armadillidium vulgare]